MRRGKAIESLIALIHLRRWRVRAIVSCVRLHSDRQSARFSLATMSFPAHDSECPLCPVFRSRLSAHL